MIESALLLFLVIDPFGNLPFVLAVIGDSPPARYRRTIVRETLLAFVVLTVFTLAGDQVLGYLSIEQASLMVAGGVILFLISLKMIFHSAKEIFDSDYRDDPFLFPIAVPSLAGPSAITAVMILRSQQQTSVEQLLAALFLVILATCIVLLLGRRISGWLGVRGIRAVEKLMGLLLNLVAVNMMLVGVKDFMAF
ncbi:MarC family protein [Methylophaga sp. OBS4]|uniref:MarC family protein n=1 Tax=Methylophaga sp. OBS4 TaxID=2991935 RepID=UPI00225C2024|nr:MarC family protein [Methylophaga sp. OBS4]MCX4187459.1 MarC family protein [Methylophaga sp. OBS4]